MGNTKKIALVTIKEKNPNFGNSLQNYASKFILNKFGFYVDTLFFECGRYWFSKLFFKQSLQKIFFYCIPGDSAYWKYDAEKTKKFYHFNNEHCQYRFIEKTDCLKEQYDYFVVGSDQVWNPKWYSSCNLKKDMYLLTFADSKQKVCMAPSFGISELPKEWESIFKEQLMTFPFLSVREASGATLIKKLTGRDAEVVIDPTLMLSKNDWNQIIKKPKGVNFDNEYMLLYFLGGISQERMQYIERIANQYGLKIYNIMEKKYKNLYAVDPGEFLYLIEHAKIVLTDSFHACVFSFILERAFLVFERDGTENYMFSRIENLLGTFSLQRKYVNSGLNNDVFECDYSSGKQQLIKEQKRATDFLERSFGLK